MLRPVRGGCSLLKLVTFYLDQRLTVVVRALGPCPPAGVAELPLGFCVSCRRIRRLWSSCCSPPRGCSSVPGCSSSTRAPWRPAFAPSPWWVSNCAGLPSAACSPVTTTLSLSVPQGGLSFLVRHLLTAIDQAGGGAGFPVCPKGAWAALTPVLAGLPASSLLRTSAALSCSQE